MQRRHRFRLFSLTFCYAVVIPFTLSADEPITLIGTIVKWRYPDSEIADSKASDAATIDADGNRTVPSTVLQTTMSTRDSVDDVLAFYRKLLTRNPENDSRLGVEPEVGRSVVFSDETNGRPFTFHTITVNSARSSTMLIITRAADEENTQITWKQYRRLEVDG